MERVVGLRAIIAILAAATVALTGIPASASPTTVAPLAATTTATATKAAARIANDYTSIFAGQAPHLDGIGWTACADPITWSVDTRALTPAVARRERAMLATTFAAWSEASGLAFHYSGQVPVTYREADYTAVPDDGVARPHHIYIGFLADSASRLITRTNPGFGGPAPVSASSPEIDGGYAFFSTDYLTARSATKARATNLMLHEVGHALGLGHAAESANIMYSIVSAKTKLGAGDVHGIRSFTKPCLA